MKPFSVPAGYEDFVSSSEVLLDEIHRDFSRKDDLAHDFVYVRMYSMTVQSLLERENGLSSIQKQKIEIESMKKIFDDVNLQVQKFSSRFRWRGDPLWFHLTISDSGRPNSSHYSRVPASCLFAAVNYNDSIEDEWFIVYVLLELTKRLKQHNLCIQVTDNDGEFLLIESADFLDSWIAPETSVNRVWIKDGAVHVIPPDAQNNSTKGNFSISSALSYLLDPTTAKNSLASRSVQRVIAARTTAVFPEKVDFLLHNVVCLLPFWAAYLIQHDSSLLSKATYAFFNTEAELLSKAVNKKSTCTPLSVEQHQQLIAVVLPWTKAQYAQATFKKFKVPRRYHDLMRRAATANSTKVNHAFDLGCRVLCGIDLVYQSAVKKRQIQLQLRNLLQERQRQFVAKNPLVVLDMSVIVATNEQEAQNDAKLAEFVHALFPNDADQIELLLADCSAATVDDSDESAAFKSIIDGTMTSDSEQWLYMEPDDFDKLIKETVERTRGVPLPSTNAEGPNTAVADSKEENTEMEHLQSMVDGFKQFLAGSSEVDGIEGRTMAKEPEATAVSAELADINWDEDMKMDMSYLEATLQNAKLSIEQENKGSAKVVEAAVNSVATKVMAVGEPQDEDDNMQTDSDDEDHDDGDGDDDNEEEDEDDDEEVMFGPSSNTAMDSDDDDNMDGEDFDDDEGSNEDGFNVKDFQAAMDEEIYDEAALLNTFSNLAKLREAISSSTDGNYTQLPMDMDGDDADAHFLANLLEAQAEGLGVPMGAFHQLFAQMGIQLPKPPPVDEEHDD